MEFYQWFKVAFRNYFLIKIDPKKTARSARVDPYLLEQITSRGQVCLNGPLPAQTDLVQRVYPLERGITSWSWQSRISEFRISPILKF